MSTLQTKIVRLGDSATLANNFELVVPTVPDGTFKIRRQNGTEILSVDAAGNVTIISKLTVNANRIAFNAVSNLISVAGDFSASTFPTWASKDDPSNSFNLATGRFQPPVAGAYQINASANYLSNGNSGSSAVETTIRKNGVAAISASQSTLGGTQFIIVHVSTVVFLNGTTDYVDIITRQNSGGLSIIVRGELSGHLIYAN